LEHTTRVTELIPDRVHRIHGVLPLDGSASWTAPSDGGAEAVSLYAISSPEGVLLVDTGLPVHREGVLDAVRSIVADRPLSIIVTRMEPDTLGNLYYLLSELEVDQVAAVAPAPNPFDYSNAFPMPRPLAPDAGEKLLRLPPQGVQTIQGVEFEVIRAPLRVLATAWLFLAEEGVLFSSDSFGDLKLASAEDPGITDAPLGEDEVAEVERHLAAKYGWLAESDAETVLDQTEAVLDARDIRMTAPTHGRVLQGAETVASYMQGVRSLFAAPTSTTGGN
jgi:flavorubredoxin